MTSCSASPQCRVSAREEFAVAESLDTGKRIVESRIDMDDIANCFDYFGKLAANDAGRIVDAGSDSVVSRISYEPVGVCALITPWNYPALQAAWKIAPCLAAGNTFVLKPAELTPHTAIMTMQVMEELGPPAGVGNLILGAGADAGAPLSTSEDVDMVSFTGGLVTGRLLAANAAATVKKVALELGGKNPNVVFADADLDAPSTTPSTARSSTPVRSAPPVPGSSSRTRSPRSSSTSSSSAPRRSASAGPSIPMPRPDRSSPPPTVTR